MNRRYIKMKWQILFIFLLISLLCGIVTHGETEASPLDVVKISGSAPAGTWRMPKKEPFSRCYPMKLGRKGIPPVYFHR